MTSTIKNFTDLHFVSRNGHWYFASFEFMQVNSFVGLVLPSLLVGGDFCVFGYVWAVRTLRKAQACRIISGDRWRALNPFAWFAFKRRAKLVLPV